MGSIEDSALVAFQPEEIVTSHLLHDIPSRLLLAMHSIGGDQRSGRRIQFFEQGDKVGDLVGFFLNRHLFECQSQVVRDGREDLQWLAVPTTAAAERLAVESESGDG